MDIWTHYTPFKCVIYTAATCTWRALSEEENDFFGGSVSHQEEFLYLDSVDFYLFIYLFLVPQARWCRLLTCQHLLM